MFCTSNEWDKCDIEKRGCEGCFYEDEKYLVERIKNMIDKEKLELNGFAEHSNYIDILERNIKIIR